ncbi:MFS transporter [uncultured Prevotella sp.]|uniref:MFS transporter n=1 Tax=uncultured Prevotella sp. TaxID=159272 RepID=UPI0025E9B981|nr:MFS transporter [uncultured Prevotella sp.]
MGNSNSNKLTLIPVMIAFFTMGFVDLVGAVSNNMQEDFGLSDSAANFFPSLVFFWFLIFSVPTGMLMNKIGRKKTVLLSIIITTLAVFLPLFDSFMPTKESQLWLMYISFSLLGIGNAIMQTSINPLVTMLVKGHLASTLTFGQFVKAIASFIAPLIAAWGATTTAPILGLSWRILFLLFFIVGMIATLWLGLTRIEEEPNESKASGFVDCLKMLASPIILLSFIGIMCHVGIDVGTNAVAPRILLERLGTDTDTVSKFEYATSIYFAFRTLGCFTGSIIMRKLNIRTFFTIIVLMMAVAMVGLVFGTEQWELWAAIALVGYGNSNVFSIVFSQAMLSAPEKKNEVSGLMIMGLFGGTIFPLFMGFASDAAKASGALYPQVWAAVVMAVGVAYLLSYIPKVKQ